MLNRRVNLKRYIDFHCHGIGRFDFTEIKLLKLNEVQATLYAKNQSAILTLYLPEQYFADFLRLMAKFAQGKQQGKFMHIAGFALEGPLMSCCGGTPKNGVWKPTRQQWQALAACGKQGLLYTILSPDVIFDQQSKDFPTDITWVAETLLDGGVLPAPGHFRKDNPAESARLLQKIFDAVAQWGYGPTITDHLFNDMPLNFKHAWRKPEDKAHRDHDIAQLDLNSWQLASLEEKLGIVPATMIRNAHQGLVKLCQNFDGEHVDLAIVKKAVELVGAENMLMMTDSIESKRLGGQALYTQPNSTLLYQHEGIVAAGSQSIDKQINNMLAIGLNPSQIELLTQTVPASIIENHNRYIDTKKSNKT